MARARKEQGLILYRETLNTSKKLSNEERLAVFDAIIAYYDGEEPKFTQEQRAAWVVFDVMRQTFEKNAEAYEKACNAKRNNGHKKDESKAQDIQDFNAIEESSSKFCNDLVKFNRWQVQNAKNASKANHLNNETWEKLTKVLTVDDIKKLTMKFSNNKDYYTKYEDLFATFASWKNNKI